MDGCPYQKKNRMATKKKPLGPLWDSEAIRIFDETMAIRTAKSGYQMIFAQALSNFQHFYLGIAVLTLTNPFVGRQNVKLLFSFAPHSSI